MESKLSGVSADMEKLKKVAKLPGEGNSSLVHSTQMTQSVSQPGNFEDTLIMGITWLKRMDLESEDEYQNNSVNSDTSKVAEPISFEEIQITPVLEATEEFLKTASPQWRTGNVGNFGISSLCRIGLLPLCPILTSLLLVSAQRVPSPMTALSLTFWHISWMPWIYSQEFCNPLTVAQS